MATRALKYIIFSYGVADLPLPRRTKNNLIGDWKTIVIHRANKWLLNTALQIKHFPVKIPAVIVNKAHLPPSTPLFLNTVIAFHIGKPGPNFQHNLSLFT